MAKRRSGLRLRAALFLEVGLAMTGEVRGRQAKVKLWALPDPETGDEEEAIEGEVEAVRADS